MKIGVAGVHYGHYGGMVSYSAQVPGAEIVGIAEADEKLRTEASQRYRCQGYQRLEDLLSHAQPDLVIEGMRIDEKAELIRLCAEAKAHVLLDKPLGLSHEELATMMRQVRQAGIQLSMWFSLRFSDPFVALKRAVDAGRLGKIVTMISTHPHKLHLSSRPAWFFERTAYPSSLCDFVCHGLDYCRWLTDAEPVRVMATAGNVSVPDKPQFQDHARCFFEMSDGSNAIITGDHLWPDDAPSFGEGRVLVTGSRGTASLRAWTKAELEIAEVGKGLQAAPMPKVDPKQFLADLFADLQTGKTPLISNRDVFQTAHACLLARDSADAGGRVEEIEKVW
jgi:predicted dehydrogenase